MRSSIAARSSWAVAYRSVVGENKWHGGNGQETDGGRGSVLHGTQPVACVGQCDQRAVKLRSTPRIAERRRRSAQAESALRSGACGPGRGTSRFCALRGTAGAEGPRARGANCRSVASSRSSPSKTMHGRPRRAIKSPDTGTATVWCS